MTIRRFCPLPAVVVPACLGVLWTAGAAPLAAQGVCVPHAAAGPALDGEGTGAGDWDGINAHTFNLGSAGGAADPNFRVRMVTTADHLYFFSENTTPLANPQNFRLTVGIAPNRMVRVSPFLAGDVAPLSNNTINNISVNPVGFSWTPWAPVPVNTDFWRVLQNAPVEQWKLEGRIDLTDIGIANRDNFDLFLMAQSGANFRFWPIPPIAPDVSNPANVTFGPVRCPSLQVTTQPLDFGKVTTGSTPTLALTITNNGPMGSQLHVTSATMPGGQFAYTAGLMKGGNPPPFDLGAGETATATVQYTPGATETTIGSPAVSSVTINTSDPDPADAARVVPMQGHARRAIDLMFILDQSGSMLDQNKWATTEWAVEVAAEVARIFKLPGDRMGAVGFGGTSGSPSRYPLAGLVNTPNPGSGSFASPFPDANPLFFTPIGYGLIAGDSSFNQSAPRKVGILMSDGIHNRPMGTGNAVVVEDLGLPAAVVGNTKQMEIHTIALGTDAGVSTPLLNDIRDHYKRPGTNPPLYNITSNPAQLWDLFLNALMNAYIVNQVPLAAQPNGGPGYTITQTEHKILAMVVWDRGDMPADIEVRVFSADGGTLQTTYTSGSPGITYYKGPNAQQPYTYVLLNTPPTANQVWRITGPGGGALGGNAHPVVLVDLNLEAVFDVRQQVNGTSNDIILSARLTDFGQRITNTAEHPVSVRASIEKPAEGLGTFLSTMTLPECGKGGPFLPPWRPRRDQPNIAAGATTGFAPGDTTVDVTLPRFARADSLFKACGRDGLQREETAELELFDDGTHGDPTANDGEYTLRFTNTQYEGSYIVRYLANGVTASGRQFGRRRLMGTYLRVDVDPSSSVFDWRDVGSDQGSILSEYFVIPRDRNGEYLGSGYTSQVEFATGGGTWWGPVVDYNNGIYGRVLRFGRETGRPPVRVSVQGEDIPHRPFTGLVPGADRQSEWEIFGSWTMLDDALNVDDALGLGIRFGAPLAGALRFELEGATTFPELGDDSVRVSQLFAGLRLEAPLMPALLASLSAGGGVMHFSGGGAGETAGAGHASGALTLLLSPHFGIRGTGRVLYVSDVLGAGGSTTGTQATVGLVFRP
jgi:hypothetical protein